MEKLLINAREVRDLIGLSEDTFRQIDGFPKPVSLPYVTTHRYGASQIPVAVTAETARNLWRTDEVRAWVMSLPKKA